jgi:hypothetical protein
MTTYPVPFPSHVGPAKISLRGRNVVGVTSAPQSGAEQVQDFSGKWWLGEITFPAMDRAKADPVLAWLDSLNGMAGTFTMTHPKRRLSKGSAAVTPLSPKVAGAGQLGQTLNIDTTGFLDVDGWMLAGDLIQIGEGLATRLHRLEEDVDLVYGAATLKLWPRLRYSPADNLPIIISSPLGLFRLNTNEPGDDTDEGGIVTIPPLPFRESL